MTSSRKGGMEWISVTFAYIIVLFLIIVIAPFLAEVQLTANMNVETESSYNQYRAHSSLAAVSSNEALMDKIRMYTVERSSERRQEINQTVRSILENQTDTYSFRIEGETGDGTWDEVLSIRSESDRLREFSSIYIASPSRKSYRVLLGVG